MSQMSLEKVEELKSVEPGDHDRMAHYARADKIADAIVFGFELEALCGKKWIPTRDYKKFPVCDTCQEIYEKLSED